jgi:hypothetical protein
MFSAGHAACRPRPEAEGARKLRVYPGLVSPHRMSPEGAGSYGENRLSTRSRAPFQPLQGKERLFGLTQGKPWAMLFGHLGPQIENIQTAEPFGPYYRR